MTKRKKMRNGQIKKNSQMIYLNTIVSIITLWVNYPNTPLYGRDYNIKKSNSRLYAAYKKPILNKRQRH